MHPAQQVADALRRELRRLADHPGTGSRAGWVVFTRYLRIHHTTEDDVLWPALRRARQDAVALLDEMEAEHAILDPLLAEVDAALRGGTDHRPATAALTAALTAHLRHEEEAVMPLIDESLAAGEWARFGAAHRERVGDDVPRYLPWLLDELPPDRVDRLLAGLRPEIRTANEEQWQPAYDRLALWGRGAGRGEE